MNYSLHSPLIEQSFYLTGLCCKFSPRRGSSWFFLGWLLTFFEFFLRHHITSLFTVIDVTVWQCHNELNMSLHSPTFIHSSLTTISFLSFSGLLCLSLSFLLTPLHLLCHSYIHALIQKIGDNCVLNVKSMSIWHVLSQWPHAYMIFSQQQITLFLYWWSSILEYSYYSSLEYNGEVTYYVMVKNILLNPHILNEHITHFKCITK